MGTVIQAYASSLNGFQRLIGKSIPYIILGFVELVICFAFGMVVYSYRIPSDPSVMLVATFFHLLAGVFYGMLLGNATGNGKVLPFRACRWGRFCSRCPWLRIPVSDS